MALEIGEYIGGQGGFTFSCYGGTDGRVVSKIKVWAATSRIKAIDIWLSDGVQRTFGKPTKPDGEGDLRTKEFTFNKNEKVTSLSLWGNGEGTRSGWIWFKTSQGREFDHGMYSWGKKQEYPQNVSSGIWAGIRGRGNSDIDSLGVVFLRPISGCTLVSVTYPTLQFSGTSGLSIVDVSNTSKSVSVLNTTDTDETVEHELSDSTKFDDVRNAWTLSNPDAGLLQFTGTSFIRVQARTPMLTSSGGQTGWQTSSSDTISSSLSSTTSTTFPFSRTINLKPSQSATLSVVARRGVATGLPFNGRLQFTTNNGSSFSYSCSGQFAGRTYAYEPTIVSS